MASFRLPDREWLRLNEIAEFWSSVCESRIASENALLPPEALFVTKASSLQEEPIVRQHGLFRINDNPKLDELRRDFDYKLSDAALGQRVRIKGKREDNDASDHELIDFGYFSKPRGFFSATGAIEPSSFCANDESIDEAVEHAIFKAAMSNCPVFAAAPEGCPEAAPNNSAATVP